MKIGGERGEWKGREVGGDFLGGRKGGEGVWRGYGGVFLFDEILAR